MFYLNENNLSKTCQDIINSDVKLVEVAKQTSGNDLLVIYCEITLMNELNSLYNDKKQLFKAIEKLVKQNDHRLHKCRYNKQLKKLYIDDSVINEVEMS